MTGQGTSRDPSSFSKQQCFQNSLGKQLRLLQRCACCASKHILLASHFLGCSNPNPYEHFSSPAHQTISFPACVEVKIGCIASSVSNNQVFESPLHRFIFHILHKMAPSLAFHHPFIDTHILEWLVEHATLTFDMLIEWAFFRSGSSPIASSWSMWQREGKSQWAQSVGMTLDHEDGLVLGFGFAPCFSIVACGLQNEWSNESHHFFLSSTWAPLSQRRWWSQYKVHPSYFLQLPLMEVSCEQIAHNSNPQKWQTHLVIHW